jgi:15-cis-phytoene synthase
LSRDETYHNRGAPPGSARWHAVLFAAPEARPALGAVFALEAEIRDALRPGMDHGVAHTKLQWWRGEVDRLAAGRPEHPITRELLACASGRDVDWPALHEALTGADLELSQFTFEDLRELDAYLYRATGVYLWIAACLVSRDPLPEGTRDFAARAGRVVRLAEVVRDIRSDAYHGRVFVPLALLAADGAEVERLQSGEFSTAERQCLAQLAEHARGHGAAALAALPRTARAPLRGHGVLAELSLELVNTIERRGFGAGRDRIDLAPFRRLFAAWRAARRYQD